MPEEEIQPPEGTEQVVEGQASDQGAAGEGEAPQQAGKTDTKLADFNNPPEDWPEDVRAAYQEHGKRMLASHTRRMQELSAKEKKVAVLEQLMSDPEISKAVYKRVYGVRDEPPKKEEDLSKVDWNSLSETEMVSNLQKMIQQEATKIAKGQIQQMQPMQQAMATAFINGEISRVRSYMTETYPDFDEYAPQIMEELGRINPQTRNEITLDLLMSGTLQKAVETLYRDLAFPHLKSTAQQKALQELNAKKKANLTPSQTASSRVKEKPFPEGASLDEKFALAFERAKKQLGHT